MGSRGEQGSRGTAPARRRGTAPLRGAGTSSASPPPITSALQWALLGLLIERPGYAYELATRFNRAYEGLLTLTTASQAYPCLDALMRHGLIEIFQVGKRSEERRRRRPKIHYRATEAGIAAFEEHLLAQMLDMDRRERLYFRKLAVLARDPQRMHSLLDRFEVAAVREHQIAAAGGAAEQHRPPGAPQESERAMVAGMSVPAQLAETLRAEARRLALAAKTEWVKAAREAIAGEPSSDRS